MQVIWHYDEFIEFYVFEFIGDISPYFDDHVFDRILVKQQFSVLHAQSYKILSGPRVIVSRQPDGTALFNREIHVHYIFRNTPTTRPAMWKPGVLRSMTMGPKKRLAGSRRMLPSSG